MTIDRELWLSRTQEKVVEPDLPIIDAHHHLWDRPGNRYMPEELVKDIDSNNVVKTVFIDCYSGYRETGPRELKPVGETEFISKVAERSAASEFGKTFVAGGIVGFAFLPLGNLVEPVLAAHIAAGKGHFRGIRHSTCWEPTGQIPAYMNSPQGLMADAKFREGFSYLHKFGLSFDAWIYFNQLTELADLAKAFPDTTIILNHVGGPIHVGPYAGKTDEIMHEWRHGIAQVAACPNTVVKLGGIGMTRTGFGWHERQSPPGSDELSQACAPYYLWCIEKFGVNRCMFESNFPEDKVSYSYTVMWNAFKKLTHGLTKTERKALFHDTAARVYRLA